MGLAEPKKRIKLSHDPRNLQWSDNANSFGQKIMQSSGWKPGTALGASSVPIPAHEASAAKVRIAVKDNTLGLGASLKSKNIEHQRTGLDAFQGLLGRLNAKSEEDVRKVEEKVENKKLAIFAQGRWGGMVFVPGGLLVQEDPKKEVRLESQPEEEEEEENSEAVEETSTDVAGIARKRKSRAEKTPSERAIRKAEKQRRKEDRAIRRKAKKIRRLQKQAQSQSSTNTATPDLTESENTGTPTTITKEPARGGRSVLRGRNILAKRAAFSDMKGLDQIFMIQQKQAA